MWGDRVQVTTCRYDESPLATRILEFDGGVEHRPFVRSAEKDEQLRDGGTRVKVWLKNPAYAENGLLQPANYADTFLLSLGQPKLRLVALLRWLCPSLDVDLYEGDGEKTRSVLKSSDWLRISGASLLKRLNTPSQISGFRSDLIEKLAQNVRQVKTVRGETVGRGCIMPPRLHISENAGEGVITVGGLRAESLLGSAESFLEKKAPCCVTAPN